MASQVENIKWVPGTRFIVDGFAFTSPRCQQYFLTHCHSDHTTGLTRRFDAGTIWCSTVSARLLAAEWGLRPPIVQQLELHQPVVIDGVTVTALDANHCPGAIMLLFEVPTGPDGAVKRILHTGDCRWQDRLHSGSCLATKRVDVLMLDTTYALPKHTFPPQEEAIAMMVELMREALLDEPETLLVVSCYHIGKERAFLGAAAALGLKVYAPLAKRRVLQLLDLPEQLLAVLSSDTTSQVHVGCTSLAPDELQAYLAKQQQEQQDRQWKQIMGFRATGWSYRRSGGVTVQRPSQSVALVGIPYSEHSSWHDLRQCVATLRPKRLIPTVNAVTRSQQEALVDRFADLMDLSCNKGRIDAYLVRSTPAGARQPIAAGIGPPAAATGSVTKAAIGTATAAAEATLVQPAAADRRVTQGQEDQHASAVVLCASEQVGPCGQLCAAATDMVVVSNEQQPPGSAGRSLGHCFSSSSRSTTTSLTTLTAGAVVGQRNASLGPGFPEQPQGSDAAFQAPPAGLQQPPGQDAFDFSSVDIAEQQQLLEEAERRKRLKRSQVLVQASKAGRRGRNKKKVAVH